MCTTKLWFVVRIGLPWINWKYETKRWFYFFDMLNRIRIGSPSDSDIELLKKRQIKLNSYNNNKIDSCIGIFHDEKLKNNKNTVCLLPLTKDVKFFNELVKQALIIST